MKGFINAPPDLLAGIENRVKQRKKSRVAFRAFSVVLMLVFVGFAGVNYRNYQKTEENALSQELLLDALMIVNNPEDELITVSSTDQNYYFQGESK